MFELLNLPYPYLVEAADPETSTRPVVKFVPRSHHHKIYSFADRLEDVAIFALFVIVRDHIPRRVCECSPNLDVAHAFLQSLKDSYETGRSQNRKHGFTVPVAGVPLRDNPAKNRDQQISYLVRQLHEACFSEVAVFWQSLSDGPCHYRVASLQIEDGLKRLTQSFKDAIESALTEV